MLIESVKYGAINTTDTAKNGFYVIIFTSEAYTLQYNTTIGKRIITAGDLVVKAQSRCSMQVNTNCYWYQNPQQHVITVPTHTILHPRIEVNAITDIPYIPKIVYKMTQAKKNISRHPICLTDSDYDYILEEIGCRDKIEFGRDVEFRSNDE